MSTSKDDEIWRLRVIDECTHDIKRGLDHSLSNAPGRVRLAEIALERLCRAVLQCPDEVLVDLRTKLAETEKRHEALRQAARDLLDAMDEKAKFSPLEAHSPAAFAWRAKYDAAKNTLCAHLTRSPATTLAQTTRDLVRAELDEDEVANAILGAAQCACGHRQDEHEIGVQGGLRNRCHGHGALHQTLNGIGNMVVTQNECHCDHFESAEPEKKTR